MNNVIEQIKKMDEDRSKMVARLVNMTEGFEKEELKVSIKEHDIAVGKLLGLRLPG